LAHAGVSKDYVLAANFAIRFSFAISTTFAFQYVNISRAGGQVLAQLRGLCKKGLR
jgi:hypothetical protein